MTFASARTATRDANFSYPPLEGEGRRVVRCERRGGVTVSPHPTVPELRDHPTPSRIPLRSMRADPRPLQGRVQDGHRHPCQLCPNLRALIHSALTLRTGLGAGPPDACFSERKRGDDVRFLKRSGSSFKLPTLRFRAKIMLGFAVVLAISAASMGFAYLGFEHVSAGVDSYRRSVQEADLSRDIDRELISYRSLARYFVVDRKGRGRQGGAGGRSRPEGRDHCLDEGHHQPDAARAGRRNWSGNSAPSPRFSPTSSRSRTRARASRKTSSRAPATRCATSSTISRAMPKTTKCR